MIDVRPILDEPPLHMSFSPGTSDRLVVSFAGVGNNRRQVPPVEFARIAHWNGQNNVLYISDQSRSWMNAPGIADAIVEAIRGIVEKLKLREIVAIGNSMGGTAALILASLMKVDRVVALVPQFSVHPEVITGEWRWTHFRDKIAHWRFREAPDLRETGTSVTILHGGSKDELMHAERFPKDAGYRHYIFPHEGHNLARSLHDQGLLSPIVTLSMLGRFPRARHAIRTAGGMNRHRFDRTRNTHSSRRH